MQTIEYRTQDKSTWGEGPWQNEPDKIQYQDKVTGYPCLIVRGPVGALCGYVGVEASHPLFEKSYDWSEDNDNDPVSSLSVHGGITLTRFCADISAEAHAKFLSALSEQKEEAEKYPRGDAAEILQIYANKLDFSSWNKYQESTAICHIPGPNASDRIWWFGFDCSHAGDFTPKTAAILREIGSRSLRLRYETYRDLDYVKAEIQSLALQLKSMERSAS